MLIFKEVGRLGNQLFQYAALRTWCQDKESLILLGFESLQTAFDGIEAKIVNVHSPRLERAIYYRLYRLADSLSQKNIIARIRESAKSPDLLYEKGLFEQHGFVEECFCQSELFFNPAAVNSLDLKPELLAYSKKILSVVAQERTPIFVHVRRGDYLGWPNKDNPAVLPSGYYKKCINIVQSEIPDAFFIFVSDDPLYVKDVFGELENSYISQGSSLEDFALMTHCQGGILSASTFAWWAAYFSGLKYPGATFIAPKYWIGHQSCLWYPSFIKATFMMYIDVQ